MHPMAIIRMTQMTQKSPRHLQTVNGQPTSGLWSTVLQFRDDGVVHVLLLLTEELRTDRVEGITT